MPKANLNEVLAAQADREPKIIEYNGVEYVLPNSPTLGLVDFLTDVLEKGTKLKDVKIGVLLPLLVGDDNYSALKAAGLTVADSAVLAGAVSELYQMSVGEFSASSSSSRSGGARSKQTSGATTKKTSAKRSSAKKR